jgi:Zn-dependent protease
MGKVPALEPTAGILQVMMVIGIQLNLALLVFNLLPIPPLDGWKVLTGLVDPRTAYQLRGVEQYAVFLIIGVFFLGGSIIGPIGRAIFGILVGSNL